MALAAIFHDTGFVIQYDKNEPIVANNKATPARTKATGYPLNKKIKVKRINKISKISIVI